MSSIIESLIEKALEDLESGRVEDAREVVRKALERAKELGYKNLYSDLERALAWLEAPSSKPESRVENARSCLLVVRVYLSFMKELAQWVFELEALKRSSARARRWRWWRARAPRR